MKSVAADYASHWLHNDADRRTDVARKLLDIGADHDLDGEDRDRLGDGFPKASRSASSPNGDVCIVQARPQP